MTRSASPVLAQRLARLFALGAALAGVACLPDVTAVNTPVAIRFIAHPVNTAANAQMAPVSVGFVNRDGAVTRNSSGGLVKLTLVTTDTSVHLLGATEVDGAYGVVIFDMLSVNKAATGLKLVAKSAGYDSVVSNSFSITP